MTSAQTPRSRLLVTGARRAIGRGITWAFASIARDGGLMSDVRFTRGRDNDRGRHTLRYENEMNPLCFAAGDHLDGFQKRPAKFKT
jgi:hypothetical protein